MKLPEKVLAAVNENVVPPPVLKFQAPEYIDVFHCTIVRYFKDGRMEIVKSWNTVKNTDKVTKEKKVRKEVKDEGELEL